MSSYVEKYVKKLVVTFLLLEEITIFAQMISNVYSFDPDLAQSILTWLPPN